VVNYTMTPKLAALVSAAESQTRSQTPFLSFYTSLVLGDGKRADGEGLAAGFFFGAVQRGGQVVFCQRRPWIGICDLACVEMVGAMVRWECLVAGVA
jgi:hypothetical protein